VVAARVPAVERRGGLYHISAEKTVGMVEPGVRIELARVALCSHSDPALLERMGLHYMKKHIVSPRLHVYGRILDGAHEGLEVDMTDMLRLTWDETPDGTRLFDLQPKWAKPVQPDAGDGS
jgi:hypothetical protein